MQSINIAYKEILSLVFLSQQKNPKNKKTPGIMGMIIIPGSHFLTRKKIFIPHRLFSSTHNTLYHIIWSFFERYFCSDAILRDNF